MLYDAVIRPWKNRLALLTVRHAGMGLDLVVIGLTIVSFFSRRIALRGVSAMLESWDASVELRESCARSLPLPAGEPLGQVA